MRCPHVGARGFTLVELLVVLVIVAVIVSVAVLSLGDRSGNEDAGAEARRLAALVELARERAELGAVEYGLDVHPDGYRFLQYDEATGVWQQSPRSVLRQRALPAGMRMELKVDAQTLAPANGAAASATTLVSGGGVSGGGSSSEAATGKSAQPAVLMLSSGEVSNFRVLLTSNAKGAPVWSIGSDGVAPVRADEVPADGR